MAISSISARVSRFLMQICWSRVEEGRGGLYRIGITPFPFPAHQTGRANFPHPAFRLASSRGTRRGAKMNPAQPKHAEIPEHGPSREPRGAARRHLVTPDQKMPHALIDVIVDRSIGRQARPVAEVVRPAAQHAVQLVAHLGPGCLVAGPQEPSRTFSLSRATLFLDGLAPRYQWPSLRKRCGPKL